MFNKALSNVNEWYLCYQTIQEIKRVLFDLTVLLFDPKLHSYLILKGLFKPASVVAMQP